MLATPYEKARRRIQRLPPSDQLRLIGEILAELGERAGDDVFEKSRVALIELQKRATEVWRRITLDDQIHTRHNKDSK